MSDAGETREQIGLPRTRITWSYAEIKSVAQVLGDPEMVTQFVNSLCMN